MPKWSKMCTIYRILKTWGIKLLEIRWIQTQEYFLGRLPSKLTWKNDQAQEVSKSQLNLYTLPNRNVFVEVGRVCGLNCHKPKSSSIRKPNSPSNIIPSIAGL